MPDTPILSDVTGLPLVCDCGVVVTDANVGFLVTHDTGDCCLGCVVEACCDACDDDA